MATSAYKGLTIRFGADTEPLQRALKNVNSALRVTQGYMRTLRSQMAIDPSRMTAMANSARVVGEQLRLSADKAATLRTAMMQLGDERLERMGMSVKEAAAKTKDAAIQAERLNTEYNRVDNTLENMKIKLNEIVSKTQGKKIDVFEGRSVEQAVEKLRELGGVTEEDIAKLLELKAVHNSIQADKREMELVVGYQRLGNEVRTTTADMRIQAQEWVSLKEKAWSYANQAKTGLDRLDTTMDELEAEARQLDAAMKLDPRNIYIASQRYRNLKEQIEVAKQRADAIQQTLNRMNAAGVKRTSESFNVLSQRVQKNETKLKSIVNAIGRVDAKLKAAEKEIKHFAEGTAEFDRLDAQIEKCNNSMDKLKTKAKETEAALKTDLAQKELRQLETELTATNSKLLAVEATMTRGSKYWAGMASTFKSLGMTLFSTLTPAAMMIGMYAITAADQIDSAYRNMRKTVEGTDAQFEQLKRDAIEFSETHFTSADQILEIEAIGGQLGIAAENLGTFAEVVSELDIATNLQTEQAAQQLGQLNGIMGDLTEDKFPNFADALVRLGNNSPTLESNIMDVTLRLASMSQTIGMSTPDVLAWSTAIAATGQKAEAAGTAIAKTWSNIETAVAGGGEGLQNFAAVAKMSAEDFATTWESNPTEALKSFIKGLRDIQDAGGSVDGTLENLGITGVRQKQAIEGLVQTIDMMDDSLQMSNDAWNGISDEWGRAGDAAREADRKSEGFSGTIQKIKNNAQELAMNMGESLTPVLQGVLNLIKGLNDLFTSLSPTVRTVLVSMVGFAAVAGPALTMISTSMTMISRLGGPVRSSAKAMQMAIRIAEKHGGIEQLSIAIKDSERAFDANTMAVKNGNVVMKNNNEIVGKAAVSNGKYARSIRVMSGALSALRFVGITAAIAAATIAIGYLVKKISDATEKSRKFKQIQRDLTAQNLNTADSIGKNTTELEKLAQTADNVKFTVQEASDGLQSLADTASEINKSFVENEADTSALEQYKQIIVDNLNATEDDIEAQARLRDAVAHVNQITGMSLTVSEEYAGWLYDEGTGAWYAAEGMEGEYEAIEKLIDAKQREMEAEAFRQAQSEVYQEEIDARRDLAEAMQQQADLQNQINEATAAFEAGEMTQDEYLAKVNELGRQLNSVNGAVDENRRRLELAAEASQSYADAAVVLEMASGEAADAISVRLTDSLWDLQPILAANDQSMLDLRNTLAGAGIDTEKFASLSTEQLQELAIAYDGSFGSIQALLDEYGVAFDEAAAKTQDDKKSIETNVNKLSSRVTGLTERMSSNVTRTVREMGGEVEAETSEIKYNVESNFAFPTASLWGFDLIDNFIGSVTSRYWSWGAGQITSVAQNIKDTLGHSVPAKGPLHNHGRGEVEWGEHLIDNIITGINNRQEALNATMNDLALMMSSPADVLDYMDSPEFSQSVSFRTVSADDVYMATLRALNDSEGTEIYLDGDVLVGKTAKRMDTALGARRSLVGRGVG